MHLDAKRNHFLPSSLHFLPDMMAPKQIDIAVRRQSWGSSGTDLSLALGNVPVQGPGAEGLEGQGHLVGVPLGVREDDGAAHGPVGAHAVGRHARPLRPVAGQAQVAHARRGLQQAGVTGIKLSKPHAIRCMHCRPATAQRHSTYAAYLKTDCMLPFDHVRGRMASCTLR